VLVQRRVGELDLIDAALAVVVFKSGPFEVSDHLDERLDVLIGKVFAEKRGEMHGALHLEAGDFLERHFLKDGFFLVQIKSAERGLLFLLVRDVQVVVRSVDALVVDPGTLGDWKDAHLLAKLVAVETALFKPVEQTRGEFLVLVGNLSDKDPLDVLQSLL